MRPSPLFAAVRALAMRRNAPYVVETTRGSSVIIGLEHSHRTDYAGHFAVRNEEGSGKKGIKTAFLMLSRYFRSFCKRSV